MVACCDVVSEVQKLLCSVCVAECSPDWICGIFTLVGQSVDYVTNELIKQMKIPGVETLEDLLIKALEEFGVPVSLELIRRKHTAPDKYNVNVNVTITNSQLLVVGQKVARTEGRPNNISNAHWLAPVSSLMSCGFLLHFAGVGN